MSEQDTTTDQVATTDTPVEGTGTAEQHNWEQRYQELQPAYTKASQEAAELRQWQEQIRTDPDAQRQLLTELGYDVADDTPDEVLPQSDSELAQIRQELEQLKQSQSQVENDRQLAAAEAHFSKAFAALGSERGDPLSEKEQEAVVGIALTMPAGKDGMPPVKEAYAVLEEIRQADQQRWAASKRTPYRVSPNGAAGTEQPNMDDPSERQAWMAQRLADLNAGQ